MEDNYFVPSFGNPPKALVGRENVIKSFESILTSVPGSRERSQLLLGQRGSGKTVLLLELSEMAKKKGFVVASPTVVSKEMPGRILEKLYLAEANEGSKKKHRVSGGSISILGFGAGVQFQDDVQIKKSFAQQLSEICISANKGGHPVAILVDEVQANSEELRTLVVAYQEMIGEKRDVALIMAGLPSAVSGVLNDHVLTFLNRSVKIDLQPLRTGDIYAYYRGAFSKLGIRISDTQIKKAADSAFGSPYMMQLLGHYIMINADDRGDIDEETFEIAINSAKEDFINDVCKTTLANLSERDIDFLSVMAQDEEDSEISAIADRLDISSAYSQTYKRRLIQSGVIMQEKRGRVKFAVPYLKDYLKEL